MWYILIWSSIFHKLIFFFFNSTKWRLEIIYQTEQYWFFWSFFNYFKIDNFENVNFLSDILALKTLKLPIDFSLYKNGLIKWNIFQNNEILIFKASNPWSNLSLENPKNILYLRNLILFLIIFQPFLRRKNWLGL